MIMNVLHNNNNNVQVNHHQVELGDQNHVCQMKHVIMFVLHHLHQKIGDDQMKIVTGVREKKNVWTG